MREFPNVTLAGDTTVGASGNPAFYDLGGGWQYSVSRWIETTANLRRSPFKWRENTKDHMSGREKRIADCGIAEFVEVSKNHASRRGNRLWDSIRNGE